MRVEVSFGLEDRPPNVVAHLKCDRNAACKSGYS